MLNVVIADDEMIVRVGMKSIIPWNEFDCQIIGEAANGLEALNLIENNHTHILITDIIMPEMNGIELLKQLHIKHPNIKVIILSCHNDFHYVQQALRLGAVDYVMKLSMQPKELTDIIEKIKDGYVKDEQKNKDFLQLNQKINVSAHVMKELILKDIMKGTAPSQTKWEQDVKTWNMFVNHSAAMMILRINQYEKKIELNELKNQNIVLFSIANIAGEIMRKHFEGEVVKNDEGEVILLCDVPSKVVWMEKSIAIAEQIRDAVMKYIKVSISAGISWRISQLPQGLKEGYEETSTVLKHGFFYPEASIITSDDLDGIVEDFVILELEEHQTLERLIDIQDVNGLKDYLDELIIRKAFMKKFSELKIREFFLDLLHPFHQYLKGIHYSIYEMPKFNRYYPYEAIHTIETFQELKAWILQFVQFYCDFIEDKKQPLRKEIDEVQKYIKQYYHEKISVSDIGKHVGFTENYLSALYKKETGENMTDYLSRLRMEKARELLKNTDLKIYEIIEEIGFTDANYFSRQFKRFEGLPPNEFRNLMKGKPVKQERI